MFVTEISIQQLCVMFKIQDITVYVEPSLFTAQIKGGKWFVINRQVDVVLKHWNTETGEVDRKVTTCLKKLNTHLWKKTSCLTEKKIFFVDHWRKHPSVDWFYNPECRNIMSLESKKERVERQKITFQK